MTKQPDDTNWREELKAYTNSKYELELLENGPRSLAASWMMGALYQKWKRIKGIPPDPPPPDCSSSYLEWERRINQQSINPPDTSCNGSNDTD